MVEPFIGQINMVAFNFAPRQWAYCDGQLLPISQNTALFSLVGTTYGGDGRTTFALPDLRGRVPIHQGRGPGLSDRRLGERSGFEEVPLTESQMPSHNHAAQNSLTSTISVVNANGNEIIPSSATSLAIGNIPGSGIGVTQVKGYSSGAPNVNIQGGAVNGSVSIANTGGSTPHSNMQPYLTVGFVISLLGTFPSRN